MLLKKNSVSISISFWTRKKILSTTFCSPQHTVLPVRCCTWDALQSEAQIAAYFSLTTSCFDPIALILPWHFSTGWPGLIKTFLIEAKNAQIKKKLQTIESHGKKSYLWIKIISKIQIDMVIEKWLKCHVLLQVPKYFVPDQKFDCI